MLDPIKRELTPQLTEQPQEAAPQELTEEMSNSPFARMFPLGASKKDLKAFVDNCLKMLVYEIKRADERAKKAQERMRKSIEGKNFYE
jgi:hypothetical protein